MGGFYLTIREKIFLFLLRFKKKIKPRFDVHQLASYGLIRSNHSSEKNEIGEWLKDGTYSLTDSGKRYFIQRREAFFVKRLPVVISLVALIKSFWPEISALFNWVIEKLS